MYFTKLPDHAEPGFDELQHFNRFKKNNVIFNAWDRDKYCDNHVGCLSFKTVLSGEESYRINDRQWVVRPGKFLMLNDDQPYSCKIAQGQSVHTFSIFFKKELAVQVFNDINQTQQTILENPFSSNCTAPEFFQTLIEIDQELRAQLIGLVDELETFGYQDSSISERLVFFLRNLIEIQNEESKRMENVCAAKESTRREVFRRLCIARDYLHSYYMEKMDLDTICRVSSLSMPQLIRQFKMVFKVTPHQYLVQIRMCHAQDLLKQSPFSIQDIAWMCGFENVSAFSRAFKMMFDCQPGNFRKTEN